VQNYRLEIRDMTKVFPGVKALDRVKMQVKPGTVHALVGENGAGKSTLMKCLFGIFHPEEGEIFLDGEKVDINSTNNALQLGISMIHQELFPVPYRNVVDNIWVGRFETKGIFVDEEKMYQKTKKLIADLELDIDPKVMAKELSVSQLQAIEIAKAVSYDARVIIMDEPTSSLTVAETKHLMKIIKMLRSEGRSIIYISHKLEEIFDIADEVTVMRDGQYIGTWEIEDINISQLINQMVGRDINERYPKQMTKPTSEPILEVKHLTSANPRSFKDISFTLNKGEILGLGGLVGAQRTELMESIFGLRKIASGEIEKDGKVIQNKSPRQAILNGFALLTEERRATGIVPMLSVKDNVLAASYRMLSQKKFGVLQPKKLDVPVDEVCKKLDVRMTNTKTLIQNLSGGNQQKVLFARWLLRNPSVLILDEPTRGVDVGAKYEIYRIMRELVAQGHSIIMISSEMPELLGMSDRIMVMCGGMITGILDKQDFTQVRVMEYATKFALKS